MGRIEGKTKSDRKKKVVNKKKRRHDKNRGMHQ